MKIHCHLCGATLRHPTQVQRVARPDEQDVLYVCSDAQRCERRAAFDPVTGKPHSAAEPAPAPDRARAD